MGSLRSQLKFDISQDESSEEFIGEWAEKRGIRDQLVIATKASQSFHRVAVAVAHPQIISIRANIILSLQPTLSGAKMKSLTK